MGTGYKNRGSGAAGLGFKNRGAKLVEGAAYTNRGATDGVNEAFKNRGQAWGSELFYNRGPNDFASLSVLGLAEFYAPLTHSLVLTRGTGDPTYSRATIAWEFGNDGYLKLVPSGAARFGGARMVRNIFGRSEAFDNASHWTPVRATPTNTSSSDPIGGNTAYSLFETAVTNTFHLDSTGYTPIAIGNVFTFSIYAKANGRNYVTLDTNFGGTDGYACFNLSNGTVGLNGGGVVAAITNVGNGWYRCSVTDTTASLVSGTARIWISNNGTVYPSYAGDITKGILIWGAQLENVTGQADQTASEYVSAGVLSAPYHGAGVDGVKWVATNKDGSAISASSLLGHHAEGARMNSLLGSRDLTNAAWAATNITPTKTATGIDNAPNSASTITAAAADATILQTLSLAAAARSFSAYVTRRTGVGPVYITRDGFATEVDISGSLQVGSLADSTKRYRVKIENSSVLNPQVGFKLATSGDAIDVDVCQDEAGAFISSPIITTTAAVTRNADALTYPRAGNIADAAGSSLCDWALDHVVAGAMLYTAIPLATDGNGYLAYVNQTKMPTVSRAYDGTNVAEVTGLTRSGISHRKASTAWSGATLKHFSEGAAAVASGSYDGTFGGGTSITVGGASQVYIKDVYIWSTALTDEQLQQVTA